MIDFANVKSIVIPEGEVSVIARGAEILWQKQMQKYKRELAYLESTGTQWIDTGVSNWNQTLEYELKLGIRQQDAGTKTYFGCYDTWATSGSIVPAIGTFTSYRVCQNFNTAYNSASGTDIGIRVGQTGIFSLKGNSISWSEGLSLPFDRSRTFTNALSIVLFSTFYSGKPREHSKFPLYYTKFWLNGELVRDFIPVLDWNDRPCMYDKVTDELFCNQGTGEFLYGE